MIREKIRSLVFISLLVASLAGCGVSNTPVPASGGGNGQAQLVSISITPTNPTIAANTDQKFTATGTYSDNTTADLTASVVNCLPLAHSPVPLVANRLLSDSRAHGLHDRVRRGVDRLELLR